MRKTISLQKLQSKFQPIKTTANEWTFDTVVKQILKRYTTATGKVIYLVEFRGGLKAKVSARSLYKRNADLVETFEHKRLLALESPDEGDEDYLPPKRKTRTESPSYAILPLPKKTKKKKKATTSASTPTTPLRSVPRSTPSPIPPRSAASTPPIRTAAEDIAPEQQVRLKLTVRSPRSPRSPPHANNCYQCNKMDTLPLEPCKSCTFSFHAACNNNKKDESVCQLCQKTKGSTCTICHQKTTGVLFRCQECKRAMHDTCTDYTNGSCSDCQSHRGKEIEKCLGKKDDKVLVKWKNKEYSHWVASSWVQSRFPDVYNNKKKNNKSADRRDWEIESILDVTWKDHTSPSRALVLYKNMEKNDAVWESAMEGNQSFDNALKIYKEKNRR